MPGESGHMAHRSILLSRFNNTSSTHVIKTKFFRNVDKVAADNILSA